MERTRPGQPEDALACATILNDWVDARPWMPRVHTRQDVEGFYRRTIFAKRKVWVVGDPVAGFLALDVGEGMVTALYVARTGQGLGRALLDCAKRQCDALELWTFQANEGARRFYMREGFLEVRRTDGDNEERLPDVLLRWERGA